MFKNIEAVIFDMDGTVIDSMGHYEAFRLQELYKSAKHLSSQELSEIEDYVHLDSEAFIQHVNQEYQTKIDPIGFRNRVRHRVAKKYREGFSYKEGFLDFINYLDEKDIPYCIATATNNENAEAVLKAMNLYHRIEFVITTEDVAANKSQPDIYLKAAEKLDKLIANTLVFEDAPHALMTAKKAGFPVIVVEDDYFSEHQEKLKKYSDYYIEDYHELLEMLENKND